jgi:hypothetical protein
MGILGPVHFCLVCPFLLLVSSSLTASVMLFLSAVFVPETYAPTLLRRKARHLQKEADEQGTGEVFISKFDKIVKPRSEIIRVGMSRPFDMMFRELIVAALGTYGKSLFSDLMD